MALGAERLREDVAVRGPGRVSREDAAPHGDRSLQKEMAVGAPGAEWTAKKSQKALL